MKIDADYLLFVDSDVVMMDGNVLVEPVKLEDVYGPCVIRVPLEYRLFSNPEGAPEILHTIE